MSEHIIVLGNGCASLECIKATRDLGFGGELSVMSDNSLPAYNPMLITYFASEKIGYEKLFPYGEGFDFYDRYEAKRFFGSAVTALDTERRIVKNADGLEISYDKCVIATGAAPVTPPPFSEIEEDVYTLRTVSDAVKFKELLGSEKKRALVVGASMVGIKAAEALVDAGFSVTLADFAGYIFPLAAHKNCACIIQGSLEKKGVKLLFDSLAEKIDRGADGYRVFFKGNPAPVETDHILMCVGVRPNVSFADTNQIHIDRGILVNDFMETSAENVYAAGDVCQALDISSGNKQVIGILSNARLQGRVAGRNAAGKKTRFGGSLPHNITHFFDQDFICIGDAGDGDFVYEDSDPANSKYCRLVFNGGRLTGVNILNISEISGTLKSHLTKGMAPPGALDHIQNECLSMNRLFGRYPGIELALTERRQSNGN